MPTYKNLGQLIDESCKRYSEKVICEIKRGFRTERFTYGGIWDFSQRFASFLQKQGLKRGDKIIIWSSNMPEYVITLFGSFLAGVIAVPIDIRTSEEIRMKFVRLACPKLIFKSRNLKGEFPGYKNKIFILDDLTELLKDIVIIFKKERIKRNDIAEIIFTSGTTGVPKGVIITHGNLLAEIERVLTRLKLKDYFSGISLLPLSHIFEQAIGLLIPLTRGLSVAYLARLNELTIKKELRRTRATSMVLVPEILRMLLWGVERRIKEEGRLGAWENAHKIASHSPFFLRRILFQEVHEALGGRVEFFASGSAPLDLKLAKTWENMGVKIIEGYGASETTGALSLNTFKERRLGSVGKVLPGLEVKIAPDHEIWVKGDTVSQGYFKNPKQTKEAFVEGWYKTGDTGYFDRDKFLYIQGRFDFKIVLAGGQKVYPEDVEKKLNGHPFIKEACVVGVSRNGGQAVHAAIITEYPNKIEYIVKDVNRELEAHQQILEYSVWPEEDFPRTPILKINRKEVLAIVQENYKTLAPIPGKAVSRAEDKLLNMVSQATGIPVAKIKEDNNLSFDLKMDSITRVELVSLIEEELGVSINEIQITPHTRIRDLRNLVDKGEKIAKEFTLRGWTFDKFTRYLRVFSQNFFWFPLFSLFFPVKVEGRENLKNIGLPAIFYFNHVGLFDGFMCFKALPGSIRFKLAGAVTWRGWGEGWKGFLLELFYGAFPFVKAEGWAVRRGLEIMGELLDRGFSIMIAPEGEPSPTGELLEFKPGAGWIAVDMGVPVVPIKISKNYRKIFPLMPEDWKEIIPKAKERVTIKIGKPLYFKKDTPYLKATEKMRKAMLEL